MFRYPLVFICLTIIAFSLCFNLWNTNRMLVDAPNYYAYLPSLVLHQDLSLNYINENPAFYKGKIWYDTIPGGKKLIMHPLGLSLVLSPFFFAGHFIAGILGSPQDGYSLPYQNALSIGILIYLITGLYYLKKTLLNFFSEKITAITLISIVLGTNLLWYSTFEGLMSHSLSFSFWCICIYTFFQWLKTEKNRYLLLFSVGFGIIILLRLLSVFFILYFLLFAVFSKGGIGQFLLFIKPRLKIIFHGLLLTSVLLFIQLCYWKYATGHWLYDVYFGQRFIFNSPQVMLFLFSFRKGVFIYTPVLLFSIIGMIQLYRNQRALFYPTFIFMSLMIYILSCWWAWSYGISWGMRPMIDYYSLLSIPMAAGFNLLSKHGKVIQWIQYLILTAFIALNLFQTWQYKNGLIHFDDMSRAAYFKGFFQTKSNEEWKDLLTPYDWNRRLKGLKQIEYSEHFFAKLDKNESVYLRGSNLLYLTVNSKAQNAMAALAKTANANGLFYIEHLNLDTICIRSKNGFLWSLDEAEESTVMATGSMAGKAEKFTFHYLNSGDNKLAIKGCNGKYVSIGNRWPFIIRSNSDALTKAETFRYFVFE